MKQKHYFSWTSDFGMDPLTQHYRMRTSLLNIFKFRVNKRKTKSSPSERNSQNKFMKNDAHATTVLETLYKYLCLQHEVTREKQCAHLHEGIQH